MPNTIHVSVTANASIANGSSSNPYATIQAAINAAQNGDTILLGDGTYKGVGNRDLSLSGKSVKLLSQNGPSKTIVDAERSGSLFTILGNETDGSKIQGLTFKNGYVSWGGDWSSKSLFTVQSNANVTVQDCVFTENETRATYVTSGLQLISEDGTGKLVLDNVLIDSNKIGGGGWTPFAGGNALIVSGGIDLLSTSITNNTLYSSASSWGSYPSGLLWPVSLTAGSSVVDSVVYGNSPSSVPDSGWLTADIKIGHNGDKSGAYQGEGSVTNSVISGTVLAKTQQNVFKDAPQNHSALGYSSQYQSGLYQDTISSSVTYTLQDGEKHLILTGDAFINGTGNSLDNSITGNNAANFLDGQAGNDTLQSGRGNNTLVGGDGDDLLVVSGGTGEGKYEVVEGNFTWEQAKADAEARGGQLVTIENQAEQDQITDLLEQFNGVSLWMGGSDVQNEGIWQWMDNTPWTYSNFAPGEPNNDGDQDYTQVYKNGTWDDCWGNWALSGYILETEGGTDSNSGNNSLFGGAGNDTLQGGGGNDTLNGGDGNDLITAGSGAGGSKYDVVEGNFTWSQAKADAEARSGHLATVGSEEEWQLIKQMLPDFQSWLGASDAEQEGNWKWVDNTPWTFSDWNTSSGEPNGGNWENYLHVFGKYEVDGNRSWNDAGDMPHWGSLPAYILETETPASGNNSLSGGTGNDTLQGALGNDTLDGGSGVDSIQGGGGDDLYVIDNAADAITENANEGTDTVRSSVARTLGANFENLELTGAAAINGTGNALNNSLTGNAAANKLDGGAGADTLRGGAGNDTYIVDNAGDVIIEATNSGTDVVQSAGSYILGSNVENLTLTGSAAINGTGNGLANQITGNAAANRISAGAGNDTLLGGAGNDTLNAGVGLDTVKGEAGSDLLQIDWTSLSGATITRTVRKDGTGATASFSGSYTAKNSAGAVLSSVTFDTIEKLSLNSQAVDLEKAVAAPGVTIKRASTTTATTEQGGTVEYSVVLDKAPFENVALNFSSSDTSEGKVNTPTLTFTPQNWNTAQTLTIQGVDDYLDDSNVAYTITGKVATTDLTYNRVTIPVINLLNNDDGQDNDRIIYGTDDTDYLSGANGKDRIYGKGGQDQLKGGIGDDRVYGDQDDDRLFGELGNDKLYGGYDDDTLDGGAGNDALYGEQGNDTLLGGIGNDYLDGGIENDSMSGGAGNDTYLVDSAGDKINDLGLSTDIDTVQVIQTISYTLPANIENAAITASGNGNLTGNTLNNGLTGNGDKNILDGGVGNDKLDGGAGADSLLGGLGNDAFLGGAGNDTMRGGDGVDLADFAAAGVDISIDLGTGKAKGDGTDFLFDIENILAGDGDDTLLGSTGANDLDGGAGTDNLNGGAGNDTLSGCFYGSNGGEGEIDTLAGGAGVDVFQLGWSSGRFYDDGNASNAGRTDYVLITDFTVGQDKLQLDGGDKNYLLGASGVANVSGSGLFYDSNANTKLDSTDELIAVIRSANSTMLNATNTINTGLFV